MPRANRLLTNIDDKLLKSTFDKYAKELEFIGWRKKHTVWENLTKDLHVKNIEKNRHDIYNLWKRRYKDNPPEEIDELPYVTSSNKPTLLGNDMDNVPGKCFEQTTPVSEYETLEERTFMVPENQTKDYATEYEHGRVDFSMDPKELAPDSLFGELKEDREPHTPSHFVGNDNVASETKIKRIKEKEKHVPSEMQNTSSEAIDELLGSSPEIEKFTFASNSQFGELRTSPNYTPHNLMKMEFEENAKEISIFSGSPNDLQGGNLLFSNNSSFSTSIPKAIDNIHLLNSPGNLNEMDLSQHLGDTPKNSNHIDELEQETGSLNGDNNKEVTREENEVVADFELNDESVTTKKHGHENIHLEKSPGNVDEMDLSQHSEDILQNSSPMADLEQDSISSNSDSSHRPEEVTRNKKEVLIDDDLGGDNRMTEKPRDDDGLSGKGKQRINEIFMFTFRCWLLLNYLHIHHPNHSV